MNALPENVERCAGIGDEEEGFYEECVTCLRRTAPITGNEKWINPPAIIAFWCEYHIEPDKEESK